MRSGGNLALLALACATAACGPETRELHYPDGTRYELAQWRGPVRHGWRRNSFPNGALEREVEYRCGEPAGTWSFYTEAGNVLTRGRYEDGRRAGTWVEHHPDGGRRTEGEYRAGEKHGLWRTWDAAGTPTYEEDWDAGTLLRARPLAPR